MTDSILQAIFWTSLFLLVYHYLLYPVILRILPTNKNTQIPAEKPQNWPHITLLIAAHNEEAVIVRKIESVFTGNYPAEKITIWVGSDDSTDKTNLLLSQLAEKYKNLYIKIFNGRQGKPAIINQLVNLTTSPIIVLTDANVMLLPDTLLRLVAPLANPKIGLVDTRMQNSGIVAKGISLQESSYIRHEVNIKLHESRIWGSMMGPFGGCFAMRKQLYAPVPANFLVDDFYLNMLVLQQGFYSINSPKAIVFEDVSMNLDDEFKRKVRIATGNFQNLRQFRNLIFKKNVGFAFISHKIIRWLGPFFLLALWLAALLLSNNSGYFIFFLIYSISISISIIDYLMRKIEIQIILLRFITHFYSMNLALFIGFIKYLKGVKTNVWQPTKRNQSQQ